MNKKDFKLWSWGVWGLILFCVYQMFYAPPTRFTIVCAYFTIGTLFTMMFFSCWHEQKWNRKLDRWRDDLRKMNDEMEENIKQALNIYEERKQHDAMETHRRTNCTCQQVSRG